MARRLQPAGQRAGAGTERAQREPAKVDLRAQEIRRQRANAVVWGAFWLWTFPDTFAKRWEEWRAKQPEEAEQCTPYLLQQIALIKPKLIVAMGRHAAQTLLKSDASIARMRGRVHSYAGVPLIVTYHPAYLLRTLEDKAKAWEDLLFARKTMQSL